jgi:hypothetical protein
LDLTNQETINEDQLQGKELYFQWCPRLAVLSPIGGISDDTYVVFGEQLVGFGASFLARGSRLLVRSEEKTQDIIVDICVTVTSHWRRTWITTDLKGWWQPPLEVTTLLILHRV